MACVIPFKPSWNTQFSKNFAFSVLSEEDCWIAGATEDRHAAYIRLDNKDTKTMAMIVVPAVLL